MVKNEEYRKKVIDKIYKNNNFEEGKELLIDWWNNSFPNYHVKKVADSKSSIYSQILDLSKDNEDLDKVQKDVIISIAGILSSISFFEEPIDKHYRKSFDWLELVRPLTKNYQSNFTRWFWNKYLDLITFNGETIHIMEIPVEDQSDFIKVAYCDYLHIKNQDGIKEIRRILGTIDSDNPLIKIMKNRTLCDIYADSPSIRNNKQIKGYAKKIFHYSSILDNPQVDRNNTIYKWYLNSANYTTRPDVDDGFYTLPDDNEYDKCIKEIEDSVYYFTLEKKETIKALLNIKAMINFAVRNGKFHDATRFLLWFVALAETGNHTKAVDLFYHTYKNLIEILLSVKDKTEIKGLEKVIKRFPDINEIFINETSQQNWEKLDYLLRKRMLPTSPLGRVTHRLTQDYLDLAYNELKEG
jgi:hypothetical protein